MLWVASDVGGVSMTKLIVIQTLRTKLEVGTESVQLCDEGGRVVGYFLPAEIYDRTRTMALSLRSAMKG